jgi:hypothetical protein
MSIVENSDEGNPDIVWGAAAIAAVIRRNERQTFYMLETGALPAKKIGKQWVASRQKLIEALTGKPGTAA